MSARRWSLLAWVAAGCGVPDNGPIIEPPTPIETGETGGGDTGASGPLQADAGEDRFVVPGVPFLLDAGPLGPGVAATWTLSDGQVLAGSPVEAALPEAGHYSVVLELTQSERVSTDGASVIAVYEPLTERPVQSGPMFLWRGALYAAVRHLDELIHIDGATGEVRRRFSTCDDPRSIAPREGRTYSEGVVVACRGDDRLQVHGIDKVGFLEETALPWGAAPTALFAPERGPLLVLGGRRGEAYSVDPTTLALQERWGLVPDGRAMALVPADDELDLLAPQFRSAGHQARLHRVTLDGGRPAGAVASLVLTPDPGPDSDTNARGVPNLLGAVAVRPDGRQVAVAGLKANVERGLARDGLPLTFETTVRSDLRFLDRDPVTGALTESDAVLFDDRDRVTALAWSERGEWLYVAHGGMEFIDVVDPFSAQRVGVSTPVGGLVDAMLVDGDSLWALSGLGRVLVRYDLSNPALPFEAQRIDLTPPEGEPVDPEVLLGERWFHRSNDPRLNTGGYVACASCHPDGEQDGLTWDFTDRGEGLRNTLPLVGRAGTEHGPLHWSANFDEPHDFEHDIRGPQQGLGLMDDVDFAATDHPLGAPKAGRSTDLDALAAYMMSLDTVPRSPHRADDGAFTDAAERGRLLFEDPARQCVACHPAPRFTDSAFVDDGKGGLVPNLHDVGTLDVGSGQRLGDGPLWGVDTPTLRGTGLTGPWGHRGQAATVLDLFPAGDTHGVTSDLSPAQLADLEAFLLQLE